MNRLELPISSRDVSAVQLQDLPRDLKRMLKVQWKEYLHYIEDWQVATKVRELGDGLIDLTSRNAA